MSSNKLELKILKIALFFLGIISISLLLMDPFQSVYSVGITLGPVQNLSQNGASSIDQQIAVNGTFQYVVWNDQDLLGNFDINFSKSTDGGTTFNNGSIGHPGPPLRINPIGQPAADPQISFSGNLVYLFFSEIDPITGNLNVFFTKSFDHGNTFDLPVNISNSPGSDSDIRFIATGSNLYVTWVENNADIYFTKSTTNGTSFDPPTKLSSGLGTANLPQLATSGNHIYLVWRQDLNSTNNDIYFTNSTDNGVSFNGGTPGNAGPPTNLSNNSAASDQPQISVSGPNAYVVWRDFTPGNYDIFLKSSNNNGSSFSSLSNLSHNIGDSSTPQIKSSSSNVYIVWEDGSIIPAGSEIFFSKSSDNGTTFNAGITSAPGNPIDLSTNTGNSVDPKISVSGNTVNVIWKDDTGTSPTNNDILLITSNDAGDTFSSFKNLSSNSGDSTNPQLATNGSKEYVVWQDDTGSSPFTYDVFFVSGTTVTTEVKFNSPQYRLNEIANITVTKPDSAGTGSISVKTNSTSDGQGITIKLDETGNGTGIFQGNLKFTSSNSTTSFLKVSRGDTVTVTTNDNHFGIASIFNSAIKFNLSAYNIGSRAIVTVDDQNANQDTSQLENVTTKITSSTDPDGINITLKETGVNTGIFEKDTLIFMNGNNEFPIGSKIRVSQEDPLPSNGPTITGGNFSSSVKDIVPAAITSDSDSCPCPPSGIVLNLTETSEDSRIFTRDVSLTPGSSVNGSAIKVKAGDIFSVFYKGVNTNGLILPNSNSSVGVIHAAIGDNINASYLEITTTSPIIPGGGGGGGGGGFIRPGLVLDVIAGIRGIGGPSPHLPSFVANQNPTDLPTSSFSINNIHLIENATQPNISINYTSGKYPLVIDGRGFLLDSYSNTITTSSEEIGKHVLIQVIIQDSYEITHLGLYTNLQGSIQDVQDSDTHITYDKGQSSEVSDPHRLFSGAQISQFMNGASNIFLIDITFDKPMPKSNIILRAWDDHKNSRDVKILDALQILSSDNQTLGQHIPQNQSSSKIYNFINNTANRHIQIQPNLMSAIKEWAGYSSKGISDSELLNKMGINANHIPNWVMKTAKWMISGELNQEDFLKIINYLYYNGMIA